MPDEESRQTGKPTMTSSRFSFHKRSRWTQFLRSSSLVGHRPWQKPAQQLPLLFLDKSISTRAKLPATKGRCQTKVSVLYAHTEGTSETPGSCLGHSIISILLTLCRHPAMACGSSYTLASAVQRTNIGPPRSGLCIAFVIGVSYQLPGLVASCDKLRQAATRPASLKLTTTDATLVTANHR